MIYKPTLNPVGVVVVFEQSKCKDTRFPLGLASVHLFDGEMLHYEVEKTYRFNFRSGKNHECKVIMEMIVTMLNRKIGSLMAVIPAKKHVTDRFDDWVQNWLKSEDSFAACIDGSAPSKVVGIFIPTPFHCRHPLQFSMRHIKALLLKREEWRKGPGVIYFCHVPDFIAELSQLPALRVFYFRSFIFQLIGEEDWKLASLSLSSQGKNSSCADKSNAHNTGAAKNVLRELLEGEVPSSAGECTLALPCWISKSYTRRVRNTIRQGNMPDGFILDDNNGFFFEGPITSMNGSIISLKASILLSTSEKPGIQFALQELWREEAFKYCRTLRIPCSSDIPTYEIASAFVTTASCVGLELNIFMEDYVKSSSIKVQENGELITIESNSEGDIEEISKVVSEGLERLLRNQVETKM